MKQSKENRNGTPVTPEVTKETELDKLKKLLASEPPQVQAVVKKDWIELDSHLSGLLKALTVKGSEVDQPSKDIKLLPDDFDTQVENVLKAVSPNRVPF